MVTERHIILRALRRAKLLGSAHDKRSGSEGDRRDATERNDDKTPEERDLLSGGGGFSWTLSDLEREDRDKRAGIERRKREQALFDRFKRDEYPLHDNTWWEDLERSRQRPDLRTVVSKSIDFTDEDRDAMREMIGLTKEQWQTVAGRKSRKPRTPQEEHDYAELGRRVSAALDAIGAGGVKLLCEAYGTNHVTIRKLRTVGEAQPE
jgi:hypothetical protein